MAGEPWRDAAARMLRHERELFEVRSLPIANRRLAVYRRIALQALIVGDRTQRKLNAARTAGSKQRWTYATKLWYQVSRYLEEQIIAKCKQPF